MNNIDLDDISLYRDIIVLYCPKKVGSTSLVSSIRLWATEKYYVFHTHDESIYESFGVYKDLTINDILKNTSVINKLTNEPRKIYFIDVFRTPIERKISEYFEELVTTHFNNITENIINYPIEKIIKRFNDIFPYISTKDYYRDIYNINYFKEFDFDNKYLIYTSNNITWIKLRLQDSSEWSNILTKLLGTEINLICDYETSNKDINILYEKFKSEYKLPFNFFKLIEENDELKFYMNFNDRYEYLNKWNKNMSGLYKSFTQIEFDFYNKISLENKFYEIKKSGHYFDDGCLCLDCSNNRSIVTNDYNDNDNKQKFNLKKYRKIIHQSDIQHRYSIFVKCYYDDNKIVDMVYSVI